MLFCTSLVALVGAGEQPAFSPRHLQIINTKVSPRSEVIVFDLLLPDPHCASCLATINYLRAYLSHLDPLRENEPAQTDCSIGRADLCV